MQTHIKTSGNIKFRKPLLVEGLPGIGNVGRIAAGYLINELKMKKFADLYSPHFLPLVLLQSDSVAAMLKCEFYFYKGKDRDIIVLTGDTQSISPEGHYEICHQIIQFAGKLCVKEIIPLVGFAEGHEVQDPRVIGAVSDRDLLKKYEKYGINFGKEHPVGTIVGASGLLIGMAKIHGMEGLCLMGETIGMPLLTDPKAADRVLHVLVKILGVKVDMSRLEKTIKEMEEKIEKTDTIHKKMLQDIGKSPHHKDESSGYIG